jgi:predicted ribosome quality control (RQC) complex YloA/Tae2 family protein
MSQHKKALDLIEEKAGLKGKILRPVSAKLLPPTEAEKKGIVSREKLLDIQGRSRKKQIELAKQFKITDYPCPAGGCLLTYKEYANKLRDLFNNKKRVSLKDVKMLKIGRHYRFGKNKIIVGRNETENKTLKQMKMPSDYWFEAQNCGSPITLLQGPKTKQAIEKAALLTAYHCDQKTGNVPIKYGKENTNKSLVTPYPFENEIERLRIK